MTLPKYINAKIQLFAMNHLFIHARLLIPLVSLYHETEHDYHATLKKKKKTAITRIIDLTKTEFHFLSSPTSKVHRPESIDLVYTQFVCFFPNFSSPILVLKLSKTNRGNLWSEWFSVTLFLLKESKEEERLFCLPHKEITFKYLPFFLLIHFYSITYTFSFVWSDVFFVYYYLQSLKSLISPVPYFDYDFLLFSSWFYLLFQILFWYP